MKIQKENLADTLNNILGNFFNMINNKATLMQQTKQQNKFKKYKQKVWYVRLDTYTLE